MAQFHKGDTVEWKWGSGTAKAEVADIFTRKVQRTFKGKKVTRKGTQKCPAYLLKQEDGAKVLKLESELSRG